VLKVLLYALISRVIWTNGPRTLENALALVLAQIYNYFMNRYWTFGHQKPAPGALQRYLMVFVVGLTADAILFTVGHRVLGINDIVMSFTSSFIVSLFTFVTHRLFTFHPDPYKRGHGVVQSG